MKKLSLSRQYRDVESAAAIIGRHTPRHLAIKESEAGYVREGLKAASESLRFFERHESEFRAWYAEKYGKAAE